MYQQAFYRYPPLQHTLSKLLKQAVALLIKRRSLIDHFNNNFATSTALYLRGDCSPKSNGNPLMLIFVSLNIADSVDERAQYTKNKAMDDQYYRDLIINYLKHFGRVPRLIS